MRFSSFAILNPSGAYKPLQLKGRVSYVEAVAAPSLAPSCSPPHGGVLDGEEECEEVEEADIPRFPPFPRVSLGSIAPTIGVFPSHPQYILSLLYIFVSQVNRRIMSPSNVIADVSHLVKAQLVREVCKICLPPKFSCIPYIPRHRDAIGRQ